MTGMCRGRPTHGWGTRATCGTFRAYQGAAPGAKPGWLPSRRRDLGWYGSIGPAGDYSGGFHDPAAGSLIALDRADLVTLAADKRAFIRARWIPAHSGGWDD
jgi:hypothetical protein